jgi:predicted MPP superfamily phosphohydrolase
MSLFFAIILSILACEIFFWWWSLRVIRPTRNARVWRTLLNAWMVLMFGGFVAIFAQRAFRVVANLPSTYLATIYLWHIVVLPATVVLVALSYGVAGLARRTLPRSGSVPAPAEGVTSPTRRQMLLAGAAAVPPVIAGISVSRALAQLGDFRVREIAVPLAALPRELDGMTIAHLTDVHVGRFTFGQKLKDVAEVTNSLRADLVLFTGDLIDYSVSDLPAALDMVRRMDPRSGLFMCQGNHDLFQGRGAFDAGVRASGVGLLVNESARVQVRGRPVEILGVRWGDAGEGREAGIEQYVPRLAAVRDPEAFPILLAHHPHAFDVAAACNLPLTLAGHTHGGQLMLTDRIGAGPMLYRYWSGLYRKRDAAAVISNGVGNWFPLRTNAPAEIVRITLRHRA